MRKPIVINPRPATLLSITAMIVLASSGCASGPPESGFLSDYSGLEEVPYDAPVWGYTDPSGFARTKMKTKIWADNRNAGRLKEYDQVLLEPHAVHLRPDADGTWVPAERLNRLAQHMRNSLAAEFSDRYPIVDKEGKGVLRFRGALTDAEPPRVYEYPTWYIIPFHDVSGQDFPFTRVDELRGLWAGASTDVWAVGSPVVAGSQPSFIFSTRGTTDVFHDERSPTGARLNRVWGMSPSDLWIVGDATIVRGYRGGTIGGRLVITNAQSAND